MNLKNFGVLVFGAIVVAGMVLGAYWFVQQTEASVCRICQRQIHARARAVIEVEGKREPVCCPRCALTLKTQQHKSFRLLEVTDYGSGRPLAPDEAYYVEGSRVIMCEQHEPLLDQTKQPYQRVFDRCEPSVYAFAQRQAADAFAASKGGTVLRLPQLLEEVTPKQ